VEDAGGEGVVGIAQVHGLGHQAGGDGAGGRVAPQVAGAVADGKVVQGEQGAGPGHDHEAADAPVAQPDQGLVQGADLLGRRVHGRVADGDHALHEIRIGGDGGLEGGDGPVRRFELLQDRVHGARHGGQFAKPDGCIAQDGTIFRHEESLGIVSHHRPSLCWSRKPWRQVVILRFAAILQDPQGIRKGRARSPPFGATCRSGQFTCCQ